MRDTISYLALLALHLAICLEPSQLSFSGLEWTILCFVVGRLFTRIGQIKDIKLLKQKRDFAGKQRERVVTRFINKVPAIEVITYYFRYSVYYPFISGFKDRTYSYELSYELSYLVDIIGKLSIVFV